MQSTHTHDQFPAGNPGAEAAEIVLIMDADLDEPFGTARPEVA